jgi:hypothetical protein
VWSFGTPPWWRCFTCGSQELVYGHEIRNIHCACQDGDGMTHFAYVTKDHARKTHYCHVFCVQTMVCGILLPSICTVLLPNGKMLFPVAVTNSTEWSQPWEADSSSVDHEILRLLWKPTVHYRVHNSPLPTSVLSQMNPIHTRQPYFLRSSVILSDHIRQVLATGIFPWSLKAERRHMQRQ